MLFIFSKLVRKYNKNTKRTEWALVSRSNPEKVLKWFGVKKPSKERVLKEERRVQWFKHKANIKTSWLKEELPTIQENDILPSTKHDVELSLKNLKNIHIPRKDIFGLQEESDFGSGLYKKDKELFPKWEFTETPQFKEKIGLKVYPSEIHPIEIPESIQEIEEYLEKFRIYPSSIDYNELKYWVNFVNDIIDICREQKSLLQNILASLSFKAVDPNFIKDFKTFSDFILKQVQEFNKLKNFHLQIVRHVDFLQRKIEQIDNERRELNEKIQELQEEYSRYSSPEIYPEYPEDLKKELSSETLYKINEVKQKLRDLNLSRQATLDLINFYSKIDNRFFNFIENFKYFIGKSDYFKDIYLALLEVSKLSRKEFENLKQMLEDILEKVKNISEISKTIL